MKPYELHLTDQRAPRGLPETSPRIRAEIEFWLDTFAGFVRDVDYASAKPLFHPRIVAFGTHRDFLPSLESWMEEQWAHVWPNTSDFQFDLGLRASWCPTIPAWPP